MKRTCDNNTISPGKLKFQVFLKKKHTSKAIESFQKITNTIRLSELFINVSVRWNSSSFVNLSLQTISRVENGLCGDYDLYGMDLHGGVIFLRRLDISELTYERDLF